MWEYPGKITSRNFEVLGDGCCEVFTAGELVPKHNTFDGHACWSSVIILQTESFKVSSFRISYG